jgi:hypothetical protein
MRIVAGIVGIASAAQPPGFVARALSSAATAPVLPHAPACACVRRITAGGCWSAPITHEQIGDSAIAKLVKVARQHVLVLLQPGGLRQRGHQLPCQGGVAPHTEQAVHVVKIVNPSPPELAVHHWCEAPHTNQTNARTQRQHTHTHTHTHTHNTYARSAHRTRDQNRDQNRDRTATAKKANSAAAMMDWTWSKVE